MDLLVSETPILNKDIIENSIPFLNKLIVKFNPKIDNLLCERLSVQDSINEGQRKLDFLPETKYIREGHWGIDPIPNYFSKRTVEITGPADRKMMINALNSKCNCFMVDLEDSMSPTWENVCQAQVNLYDASRRNMEYMDPVKNKKYVFNKEKHPIVMVRPRGIHLPEINVLLNNYPVFGCLFDFGVFVYNNGAELIKNGNGINFYLPKLQNYQEAELWNQIFDYTEKELGFPEGSIKCTVLIEHIQAAFQMEEILYVLRKHIVAMNSGRWDYIFSIIKTFQKYQNCIFPDRNQITMDTHCMESYVNLLVQTCHKRGAMAIGGMAAQLPVKNDPELNQKNMEKVYLDKKKEVEQGVDGTWIAHPALLQPVLEAFEKNRPKGGWWYITAKDLLTFPKGTITRNGVETNVKACLIYLDNWIKGKGAVAMDNKMEDAATAEISRVQIWQWLNKTSTSDTKEKIDSKLISKLVKKYHQSEKSSQLFLKITNNNKLEEFMTIAAYLDMYKDNSV
jgi:malate synthase